MATIVQRAADARPAEDPVLTGPLGSTRDGPRGQLGVLSMALSVARKRGYAWGISRSLGAAVLLEAMVESRDDDEDPSRNEKVVGSIPTGGSTSDLRKRRSELSSGQGPWSHAWIQCPLRRGLCRRRPTRRSAKREGFTRWDSSSQGCWECLVDQVMDSAILRGHPTARRKVEQEREIERRVERDLPHRRFEADQTGHLPPKGRRVPGLAGE